MLINIHHKNTQNIGDLNCNISAYYDINCKTKDIMNYDDCLNCDIIFGGGMLLKKIRQESILDKITGKKIGWGVGNTKNIKSIFNYKNESIIPKFDLLGVRDYGIGLRYVPCVTCKSNLFDKEYNIKNEYVLYTNKFSSNVNIPGIIKQDNEINSMEDVIHFLGSAETIITTSYHGVYWGLLLGRKVIALPFNSKFYSFKYSPLLIELNDVKRNLKNGKRAPKEYLEECRNLNDEFYEEVKDLL